VTTSPGLYRGPCQQNVLVQSARTDDNPCASEATGTLAFLGKKQNLLNTDIK
jgi:hypothetical protein